MGELIDLTLTTASDQELRRRAAAGDDRAVAEMARRSRVKVARAQAVPSKRGGGNGKGKVTDVATSCGGKRLTGGAIEGFHGVRVA